MHTKVKICGITNIDDARVALDAGADYIGFIFFSKSPRYIEPDDAAAIVADLHDEGRDIKAVGVFVDEDKSRVAELFQTIPLYAVQLHGTESTEYVDCLHEQSVRVIKAFRVKNAESLNIVNDYDTWAILCDAWHPTEHGGTGTTFDHQLVADLASKKKLFLAGGLHPENAAEAARRTKPFSLDVSSGVEVSSGLKDHEKVKKFIKAVKKLP